MDPLSNPRSSSLTSFRYEHGPVHHETCDELESTLGGDFDAPHQGVPFPLGDPLESSRVARDPLFAKRGLINQKDGKGQSSELGF